MAHLSHSKHRGDLWERRWDEFAVLGNRAPEFRLMIEVIKLLHDALNGCKKEFRKIRKYSLLM